MKGSSIFFAARSAAVNLSSAPPVTPFFRLLLVAVVLPASAGRAEPTTFCCCCCCCCGTRSLFLEPSKPSPYDTSGEMTATCPERAPFCTSGKLPWCGCPLQFEASPSGDRE